MAPFDACVPVPDVPLLPPPASVKALAAAPVRRRRPVTRTRAACPLTARPGGPAAEGCTATSCCGCPLLVDWM